MKQLTAGFVVGVCMLLTGSFTQIGSAQTRSAKVGQASTRPAGSKKGERCGPRPDCRTDSDGRCVCPEAGPPPDISISSGSVHIGCQGKKIEKLDADGKLLFRLPDAAGHSGWDLRIISSQQFTCQGMPAGLTNECHHRLPLDSKVTMVLADGRTTINVVTVDLGVKVGLFVTSPGMKFKARGSQWDSELDHSVQAVSFGDKKYDGLDKPTIDFIPAP